MILYIFRAMIPYLARAAVHDGRWLIAPTQCNIVKTKSRRGKSQINNAGFSTKHVIFRKKKKISPTDLYDFIIIFDRVSIFLIARARAVR